MNNTNYDRIKNMSLDEMIKFFTELVHTDIITTADRYICKKCKAEHNGECPIGDDDNCLYDASDYVTVKLWLTGNTERTKTIVEELRAKPSRDNRNLLDRAADRIEELEAKLKQSENTIELPCKIGDTVYIIDEANDECGEDYVLAVKVLQFFINEHGIAIELALPLGMRLNTWMVVGENVFLTEEEAEKALAKMKGGAE